MSRLIFACTLNKLMLFGKFFLIKLDNFGQFENSDYSLHFYCYSQRFGQCIIPLRISLNLHLYLLCHASCRESILRLQVQS